MIVLVIILQLILCFWQSIASVVFRSDNGMLRYYLALNDSSNGNPSNNFAFWIISFLTFWMLFSYLVPISLFVTMEIVKFMYVAVHHCCCVFSTPCCDCCLWFIACIKQQCSILHPSQPTQSGLHLYQL